MYFVGYVDIATIFATYLSLTRDITTARLMTLFEQEALALDYIVADTHLRDFFVRMLLLFLTILIHVDDGRGG